MTCTRWSPDQYCTTGPHTHHQRSHWQQADWLCPSHYAEMQVTT